MFSFDLKSGYHHVEFFYPHTHFLGFSWIDDQGKLQFFKFKALPFGLSSAPYIFTKLLRPVVAYWRRDGIKNCIYLDDGLVNKQGYKDSKLLSVKCCTDLLDLGLLPSPEKCQWEPKQVVEWTGNIVDSVEGVVKASRRREADIVRSFGSAIGKIISTTLYVRNLARFRTRYMVTNMLEASYWDMQLKINELAMEEIQFWKENFIKLNGKKLWENTFFDVIVFSDASNTGGGGYLLELNGYEIVHNLWDEIQKTKSSAYRELYMVLYILKALVHRFQNKNLYWHTDNQSVERILKVGSKKSELHHICSKIMDILTENSIGLEIVWIPREHNVMADYFAKIIDIDDYAINDRIFLMLENKWGPFTVDRCASYYNKKLTRFNSRFWNPGTEAVNCFTVDWSMENNYCFPPPKIVGNVVKHMCMCKTQGVVIVPLWKSAAFWPMICHDGKNLNGFIVDWMDIPNDKEAFMAGRAPYYKMSPAKELNFRMLALKIDFRNPRKFGGKRFSP